MGLIVGLGVLVLEAAFMILVGYPAVFGFLKGLFGNSDLGTLVGLVGCLLITGTALTIALTLAALAGAAVGSRRG